MVGFYKRVFWTWNQFNITSKYNTSLLAVLFRDSGNCKRSLNKPVKLDFE
jgi:hypothetical protein